jgi:general secretion pathway protein G
MKLRRSQPRSAFTLVELLVVITIIIILMSLLLTGINKIWNYVDEVKTTNEIAQISQACEAFKARYGRYPPSRIVLASSTAGNPVGYNNLGGAATDADAQLQRESVEYLQAIFQGIDPNNGSHDWTGGSGPAGRYYLEGQECLVFFLGGMRYAGSGFTGFCTDPTRPTFKIVLSAGSQRVLPFFDFDMSRTTNVNPNSGNTGGFFLVYLDPYKTPYAYFAARAAATNNYSTSQNIATWGYTTNTNVLLDCFNLIGAFGGDGTAFPFVQNLAPGPGVNAPNGRIATYHRANSFQIVSAGKDKVFGGNTMPTAPGVNPQLYGNPWVPNSSNAFLTPEACDDITNFSGGVLVAK